MTFFLLSELKALVIYYPNFFGHLTIMAAMAGPPAPPPPPSGFHKKDLWGPYPVDDDAEDDDVDRFCSFLCNCLCLPPLIDHIQFIFCHRTFESVINAIEFHTLGREFA